MARFVHFIRVGSFFANRTQAVEQNYEASSSASWSMGMVLPKVQLIITSKASKNSSLFNILITGRSAEAGLELTL